MRPGLQPCHDLPKLNPTNPSFPIKDAANGPRRDIKAPGDQAAFHDSIKRSDFVNLRLGKMSVSDISAFRDHIPDIVTVGSKKQMIRSDAWRVIAQVKNLFADWNRTEVDDPAKAVREFDCITSDPFLNSSIAFRESASPKEPAPIALNDSTPKSGDDGWRKSLRNQIRKTINRFRHIGLSLQRLTRLGVRYGFNRSDAAFFLTQTS